MPKTTFADVAGRRRGGRGALRDQGLPAEPGAVTRPLGAKIPKGVLLYGPPGTGKTLLARAVAGEAGVPFFTISGSDFVEMFVGVGASRVRDLFEQAKQNAPVHHLRRRDRRRRPPARRRPRRRPRRARADAQPAAGRDGRLRRAPGRHPDRRDQPARHPRPGAAAAGPLRPADPGVRPGPGRPPGGAARCTPRASRWPRTPTSRPLAKRTVGMSGADLANVINEAALLTARENGTVITGRALEEAVDRVIGGPRAQGGSSARQEKKITAYHEGGHTLAAWAMPDIEPIYKVTILARGRTGGHAVSVPEDDKGLMTRSEMIARLVFAMGGRAAEELVFREPTTGAVSDIEQATKIARAMVTEYGMSRSSARSATAPSTATRSWAAPWAPRPTTATRSPPRHRRRGPQAHRGRAHRGVGDPHRVPRRARHAGRRAAGEGDAAQGAGGRDLHRAAPAALPAGMDGLRAAGTVGQSPGGRARAHRGDAVEPLAASMPGAFGLPAPGGTYVATPSSYAARPPRMAPTPTLSPSVRRAPRTQPPGPRPGGTPPPAPPDRWQQRRPVPCAGWRRIPRASVTPGCTRHRAIRRRSPACPPLAPPPPARTPRPPPPPGRPPATRQTRRPDG